MGSGEAACPDAWGLAAVGCDDAVLASVMGWLLIVCCVAWFLWHCQAASLVVAILFVIGEFSVAILIWFSVWVGHWEHILSSPRAAAGMRLGDDVSAAEVSLLAIIPLGGTDRSQTVVREAAASLRQYLIYTLQERHRRSMLLLVLEPHRLHLLFIVSLNILIKLMLRRPSPERLPAKIHLNIPNIDISIFIIFLCVVFGFILSLQIYRLFRQLLLLFGLMLLEALLGLPKLLYSLVVLGWPIWLCGSLVVVGDFMNSLIISFNFVFEILLVFVHFPLLLLQEIADFDILLRSPLISWRIEIQHLVVPAALDLSQIPLGNLFDLLGSAITAESVILAVLRF